MKHDTCIWPGCRETFRPSPDASSVMCLEHLLYWDTGTADEVELVWEGLLAAKREELLARVGAA